MQKKVFIKFRLIEIFDSRLKGFESKRPQRVESLVLKRSKRVEACLGWVPVRVGFGFGLSFGWA